MKIEILTSHLYLLRDSRSRDRMVIEFMIPIQSVPITSYEFESRSWLSVLNTTLCDKVCQKFDTVWWFHDEPLV
jgi:hypothetical protein